MCDTFVNACAKSATTRDAVCPPFSHVLGTNNQCLGVKTTIDAELEAGTIAKDQTYADAWLSGLETAFGITSTGRGTEGQAAASGDAGGEAAGDASASASATESAAPIATEIAAVDPAAADPAAVNAGAEAEVGAGPEGQGGVGAGGIGSELAVTGGAGQGQGGHGNGNGAGRGGNGNGNGSGGGRGGLRAGAGRMGH